MPAHVEKKGKSLATNSSVIVLILLQDT